MTERERGYGKHKQDRIVKGGQPVQDKQDSLKKT
jgi:hypothetical protein